MGYFSEELRMMDRNTVSIMVDELQEALEKEQAKNQEAEEKVQKAETEKQKAEERAEKAEERIKRDTARRMLQNGKLTVEEIAGCLGLSVEEVAALRDDEN